MIMYPSLLNSIDMSRPMRWLGPGNDLIRAGSLGTVVSPSLHPMVAIKSRASGRYFMVIFRGGNKGTI